MSRFRYLKIGLSAVLIFVGAKMVFADIYKVPIAVSLGVIAAILAVSIIASLLRARHEEKQAGTIATVSPRLEEQAH
jgi:tellurite resistance protein TerC